MTGFFPAIAVSLLYGILGLHFWLSRWRHARGTAAPRPAPTDAGAPPQRAKAGRALSGEKLAILGPFAVHTIILYQSLFGGAGFNLGVGNAVSTIAWLTVLIYWISSLYYNFEGLQALILPVAALGVLAPVALPETHDLPYTGLTAFKLHLLISLFAYSLFTIAALHALLMAFIERRLHGGTLPLANLPPLLTMETLLFRLIKGGFILLTLTLVSGMLFSEELFGKPLQFNHKTVFGVLSWAIYAALLGGRAFYGWRGRTAIRWSLSGFAMLMLAYVGSKFVLEVLLQRS